MRKPGEDPSLSRPSAARRLMALSFLGLTRALPKENRGCGLWNSVLLPLRRIEPRHFVRPASPGLLRYLGRQHALISASVSSSCVPPAAQGVKQRHELEARRRQIIFHAQRISLELTAHHNAGVLQLAKLQGEHLVGDGGIVPAQVAEAFRALLQIVDQQTRPATAEYLHHFFDGTA